jgi:hypothetical protein
LILGLLVSNYWVDRPKSPEKQVPPSVFLALAVVILIGLHQLQKEVFDFSVLALLFGALVWLGIQCRPAVFNSKLFYWGSRLSFGMYLNHEYMVPFLVRFLHSHLLVASRYAILVNLLGVASLVIVSAAVSLITFCCVEHPFLQLRKAVLGRQKDRAIHIDEKEADNQIGELAKAMRPSIGEL